MDRFPYIVLISRGRHTHHPPYPTRMPLQIADDVIAAINSTEVLDMTARKSSIYLVYALHMRRIC
jgi:hypothetical protein